ncbi:unnamed protein product, partial [Iphiclides podalirius]
MMGRPRRPCLTGIHLLITSQISYSLVLLTANIDDVRKLARELVSAPVAEEIVNFLAKANVIKSPEISRENIQNAQLDKMLDREWNRDAKREASGVDEENDEKEYDNNGLSDDKGTASEGISGTSSIAERKKNYVLDFALKQDNVKEPRFEWKKAANFDFLLASSPGHAHLVNTPASNTPENTKTPSRLSTKKPKKTVKPAKARKEKAFEKLTTKDESDKSESVSLETSSETEESNPSVKILASTRFADYYDRAHTNKDVIGKDDPTKGSIYTKNNVLATSGPLEIFQASVKLADTSEERSLNDENRKYFKQYDSDGGFGSDFRRHLEPRSGRHEASETIDETKNTTPKRTEDTNVLDSEIDKDYRIDKEESTNRTTDAGDNNGTDYWYDQDKVYNELEQEQEDADDRKRK